MKVLAVLLISMFLFNGCADKSLTKEENSRNTAAEADKKKENKVNQGDIDSEAKKTDDITGSKKVEESDSKVVEAAKKSIINPQGNTIEERFDLPEGFERVAVEEGSFQEYLRTLILKPHGSKALYFNGREKDAAGVYDAVIDVDIGERDLHQCADAVMLLRAEYLLKSNRINDIHFNFVNGFRADYSKWTQGWRIKVTGNNATWVKSASATNSYESFRRYMDMVFAYAGTLSLEKELKSVDKNDMRIGDVFIKGASPGHAVIVVDMAENKSSGEKLFLLAQSYMPAQQTQILCNNEDFDISPWYSLNYEGKLHTPQWVFEENSLRRFEN